MSGREAGRDLDPQTLEVVPGFERQAVEGWVPDLASEDDVRAALEQAFSYRGDVKITRKDGLEIEGYVFDRRMGRTLAESTVRLLSKSDGSKVSVPFSEVARLVFPAVTWPPARPGRAGSSSTGSVALRAKRTFPCSRRRLISASGRL